MGVPAATRTSSRGSPSQMANDDPQNPGAVSNAAPAPKEQFQPVAALLALLFPGAGHAYIGETWRAGAIAVGVLGLFFSGLLIGGIDAVDRQEDKIWYLGEALVGPVAWGTDYIHQTRFKGVPADSLGAIQTQVNGMNSAARADAAQELLAGVRRTAYPNETLESQRFNFNGGNLTLNVLVPAKAGQGPPNMKSIGRVNELGTLYCTIAGMLNVICIIDAAFRPPRRRRGGGAGA